MNDEIERSRDHSRRFLEQSILTWYKDPDSLFHKLSRSLLWRNINNFTLNLKSVFISRFQAAAPNANIAANPTFDIHNGLGHRISSGLYCGWKRALGRNSDVWLQYCIDDHDNWSVFKYDSDVHNDVHNDNYNGNYNHDNHDNNNDNYYDKLVQHKIL